MLNGRMEPLGTVEVINDLVKVFTVITIYLFIYLFIVTINICIYNQSTHCEFVLPTMCNVESRFLEPSVSQASQ